MVLCKKKIKKLNKLLLYIKTVKYHAPSEKKSKIQTSQRFAFDWKGFTLPCVILYLKMFCVSKSTLSLM